MSSRFSITEAPALEPAVCWITRSGQGPFIDTGVDIGRMHIERGRIYLSFDALREMARVAGILDEGKSASVELKEIEWFNKGYSEALKENYGDLLTRLADRVGPGILDVAGVAGELEKEIKMAKIYKAYVYQDDRCFTGEIEGININTNVVELKGTPVEFYADSKQALLADMVKFLKGTGHTGVLRVANGETA
jgi:hypothetical protein